MGDTDDMWERAISRHCFADDAGRQMRFIAGPRQVGKTTMVRNHLKSRGCERLYFDWDSRALRGRYREEPYFFHADALRLGLRRKPWVAFDEMHKFPRWKDVLKDFFDTYEDRYRFAVTGSARLDLFRKAGDPLSGRCFLFRLLPLSLFEAAGSEAPEPVGRPEEWIESRLAAKPEPDAMDALLRFSGFPEPLRRAQPVFGARWREQYVDSLVRGELRDLTRIQELENAASLFQLLPSRVGAPLSVKSVSDEMSVSYNAVKNYLRGLHLAYGVFSLSPYAKRLSRAVKKEKKVYFFDWTCAADPSKRFENYVACELRAWTELWSATTASRFDLRYVRTRDGKETDFLITRDGTPSVLLEAKTGAEGVERHHLLHAGKLGSVPVVQVVAAPGVLRTPARNVYVVSASRFLA